ncbi:hypothetical protein B296_00014341 [Ensete ventricosum]|uniref:Uncharacterized protein n=1 Tax=Ensete ventricosum TaxID=4639 RepID=A0A426ZWM4_ENSVE|nr:hypothetical protein B296_00014341 [Ensete ventricosum]
MASSLLSRSLAVLRPIRSSACAAHDSSKIFNPFSKVYFLRRFLIALVFHLLFSRIVSSGRSGLSSLVRPSTRSVRRFEFTSTSLRATTSAIHSVAHSEPVVSADWLLANLREPDVKVLS